MSDQFTPTSPDNVSMRPVSRGMVSNQYSVTLPDGSFQLIDGYVVTHQGPRRLGGLVPGLVDASGDPVRMEFLAADERIEDASSFWKTDGTQLSFVVTNRYLYAMTYGSGYSPVPWVREYTVASISSGGGTTTLNVTGNFTTDYVATADLVWFGSERLPIANIVYGATTVFTLTGTFVTPPTAGQKFKVLKTFKANDDYYVDFTQARNNIILVDGGTRLTFKYDGTWLTPMIFTNDSSVRTLQGARTVTYFGERLYFGGVLENDASVGDINLRNRIRWTEIVDWTKVKSASYIDLSRTAGLVVKMLGIGSQIITYCTDSIYAGRQTNTAAAPYAFDLVETAGISAVSMKAVSSFLGGQLFVGADNVYALAPGTGMQPIGNDIADTLQQITGTPYKTYMRVCPELGTVLVFCSRDGIALTDYLIYDYMSKAWSIRQGVDFAAPSVQLIVDDLFYSELDALDTYETTPYADTLFRAIATSGGNAELFTFSNLFFMRYVAENSFNTIIDDTGGVTEEAIASEIVSPDIDFNAPDEDKTVLRLGVRISDIRGIPRAQSVRLRAEASTDNGNTWKYLGTLTFPPGRVEDMLNFRVTGSTIRFRLRGGSTGAGDVTQTEPYLISEVTLRVRQRSVEVMRGASRLT